MLMAMAIYMKGDRPFAVFLSSKPGVVFLVTIPLSLIAGAVIIHQYVASKRSPSRHFSLIVVMNLVTVMLALLAGEIAIRTISRSSNEVDTVMNAVLLPKDWEKVALYHRGLFDPASSRFPYLVPDDLMGWTVGPNKRSADGLYWISSEGIRAPHVGVSFAKDAGRTRIALVGDSFTFSQDVTYEDSWGYRLEKASGLEFQVLNFGVPGFGIDQAYLRYEKDVRKWKPKIVIFGFIADDFIRTMTVYPFIKYPGWNLPFSKPRFILRDGDLKRINVPPLAAEAIFSRGSISELPFLEYEGSYKQSNWEKSLLHLSFLARFFVSVFPGWSEVNPDVSVEALVLVNAAILKDFVRSAAQTGAIPIVVYFPSKNEYTRPNLPLPIVKQVLHEADIAYTDLSSCLLELNPADRFNPKGYHYSPQGNAAVANCLLNVVNEALTSPPPENHTIG